MTYWLLELQCLYILVGGDYLKLMKDTLSDAGEWNEAWNLTEDEKNMLKDSSGELFINHNLFFIRPCYIDYMAHMI